jgi:quercetin dioxygenase-like cupin family protein
MADPHFPTLDRPRRQLFPGVEARLCWTEKMMMALVDLAPHSVVTEHQHPHEQVGMILKGRVKFIIGGEERLLQAGDWYLIPGGVRHKVITLEEPAQALDVFAPPREDYQS